jgi:hypothetical protein
MRAEAAINKSIDHLVCAETANGLVTIYYEEARHVSAEPFHLRFTPRDTDGLLNSRGTVMVGSYDDLEIAVSEAKAKYGAGENEWQPIKSEDLPKGGHGPPDLDR